MRSAINKIVVSGIVFLSLAALAYCQKEAPAVVETNTVAQPASVQPAAPSQDGEAISWVWGEVKSADSTTAELTVTYMDYQTDEEKELVLGVSPETKFEGVSGLGEIKAGDTASIDYLTKDGKNIAKNISIEKIGEMPEAPVKETEAPVEAAAPAAAPVQ